MIYQNQTIEDDKLFVLFLIDICKQLKNVNFNLLLRLDRNILNQLILTHFMHIFNFKQLLYLQICSTMNLKFYHQIKILTLYSLYTGENRKII